MGYIKHHTVVVTSCIEDLIMEAHKKAKSILPLLCSDIIKGTCNRYNSFFIAPDGSKEGWDTSDEYDLKRKELVDWIEDQKYEDGSNSISYVELFFGEDEGKSKIINHN